jgi:hypothetical protein
MAMGALIRDSAGKCLAAATYLCLVLLIQSLVRRSRFRGRGRSHMTRGSEIQYLSPTAYR